MRFIHTSDWHIGRQFHNVSLLDDQRHVLEQIVTYIKHESVDAVVIAGDVYDRSVPSAQAVELLDDVLNTICSELNVPVVLIPGNHDGAERLRFASRQLKQAGLHIIGELEQITHPVVIKGSACEVAFYGIPYNDPETVRSQFKIDIANHDDAHRYLLSRISEVMSEQTVNVLLSHCYIDGAEASESERPLSIGGADRVNFEPFEVFDYVALGHLHSPQHKAREHIRYSGSILKYSFSEQYQKKGVTLVDLDEKGFKTTQFLPLKPLREVRIIEGELHTILENAKSDPGYEDYLLIRLTDRNALLDPMGKLRESYPNVLHLEKPGIFESRAQQLDREKLRHGELEMFRDFFKQAFGSELTPEQDQVISATITELNKHERAAL